MTRKRAPSYVKSYAKRTAELKARAKRLEREGTQKFFDEKDKEIAAWGAAGAHGPVPRDAHMLPHTDGRPRLVPFRDEWLETDEPEDEPETEQKGSPWELAAIIVGLGVAVWASARAFRGVPGGRFEAWPSGSSPRREAATGEVSTARE